MAGGRHSEYTPEIGSIICDGLAAGRSLRSICSDDGMPVISTVCKWNLDNVQGFSEQYARARRMQAELLADELFSIADDGTNDVVVEEGENGKTFTRTDHDVINRSRLRVDTRKWYLSKVLPKIYGDKLDLNHSGEVAIKRVVADL